MTAETDRAAALKAAIQDIARDLEADLGKRKRCRGGVNGKTRQVERFIDPGVDVASYRRQLEATFDEKGDANMESVTAILRRYAALLGDARSAFSGRADAWGVGGGVPLRGADAVPVLELIQSVAAIRTHEDAVAVVASFEVV